MTIYRGPWRRTEDAENELRFGDAPAPSVRRLTEAGFVEFRISVQRSERSLTVYCVVLEMSGQTVRLELSALEVVELLDELALQL